MQEFESISASSYDPSALATKLNAKSADGWSVVAIVPTGGDVTAFLSRDKSGADTASSGSAAASHDDEIPPFVLPANNSSGTQTMTEERQDAESESVSEPAGWAIAPEAAAATTAAGTTPTLAGSGSAATTQSTTESAPAAAAAP